VSYVFEVGLGLSIRILLLLSLILLYKLFSNNGENYSKITGSYYHTSYLISFGTSIPVIPPVFDIENLINGK